MMTSAWRAVFLDALFPALMGGDFDIAVYAFLA
jgi:hypothetical protein